MRVEAPGTFEVPRMDAPTQRAQEKVRPPGVVTQSREEKPADKPGEERANSARQLDGIIGRLNLMLEITWYDLRFRIHEASKEIIVQVVNRETGEVLREIPPEKILDMWAEMKRLIGMLFDHKV